MLAFFGLKGAAAKESWATVDVNVPQAQAQMIASPTSTEQEPVERARTKTQPHTANAHFFLVALARAAVSSERGDAPAFPHGFRLSDFAGDIENGLNALKQMETEERGTSRLINDVAEALREQGRLEEARALFTEALGARRAALGPEDPAYLTSLNNLGLLLRQMGEMGEARELLTEAVETRRAAQGDDHRETLTAINNLGALLKAQGALSDAEPLYEEALTTRRAALGDEHPDTLTSINNLASLYTAQGNLEPAEVLLYEAAATAQRVLGNDHPHTRIFAVNLKGVRGARNPNAFFTAPTQPQPLRDHPVNVRRKTSKRHGRR